LKLAKDAIAALEKKATKHKGLKKLHSYLTKLNVLEAKLKTIHKENLKNKAIIKGC